MPNEAELTAFREASRARLARLPAVINHVHLIGVGGVAMTALAGMLRARGLRITGSDAQVYEPAASLLRKLAVEAQLGFDPKNLDPRPDLVVIGNAITASNPEAQAVLDSGIAYVSMPEALRHFFLRDRTVLMVSGTHGKTTSTAMAAWVLLEAGYDPGLFVGGMVRDLESNYRLGSGNHFVIEGDEYDTAFFDKSPKFLHYGARAAIITSVEFDHADIYRDLGQVQAAFRRLVKEFPRDGVLVVCADSGPALEIVAEARARVITFGLEAGEYRAVNLQTTEQGTRFSVLHPDRTATRDVSLALSGRMNVANALGVYVLMREAVGLDDETIARGLASFRGVKRRQEVVGEVAGITVIDDFAHHPTAVRATLEALAERFPNRRLLAAFEPRSNTSRRRVFQEEFAHAFDRAAYVWLGPVHTKSTDSLTPDQTLDTALLAQTISRRGPHAEACESSDALLARVIATAAPGDVVVFMSNGQFDNLPDCVLKCLGSRQKP